MFLHIKTRGNMNSMLNVLPSGVMLYSSFCTAGFAARMYFSDGSFKYE